MNSLQTYLEHFSGFVTVWVTNTGVMFAGQIRERERSNQAVTGLRARITQIFVHRLHGFFTTEDTEVFTTKATLPPSRRSAFAQHYQHNQINTIKQLYNHV